VIEPDACGEGQQLGEDSGTESVQRASAVSFEAEAVFEGPEDALDALANPGQGRPARRLGLARRAQDRRAPSLRGLLFEVASGVTLAADDQLAAVQPDLEGSECDLALLLVGGGDDRGSEQMQAYASEPAAVTAAAMRRASGLQLRAPRGIDRAPALHRR
jgi:hypothetical protein